MFDHEIETTPNLTRLERALLQVFKDGTHKRTAARDMLASMGYSQADMRYYAIRLIASDLPPEFIAKAVGTYAKPN